MVKEVATAKDISIEDLSNQISILKNDIAKLTGTMTEFGKSKSREAADHAKSTAQGIADTGRDKALEAQLHAEEFVRTQPATALGIAAGVGFLAGLIATRR